LLSTIGGDVLPRHQTRLEDRPSQSEAAQLLGDVAGEPLRSFNAQIGELSCRTVQTGASFCHLPLGCLESCPKIGHLAELSLQPLAFCQGGIDAAPVLALDLLERGQSRLDLLETSRVGV